MIDVHCHILPEVDDGCKSAEESLINLRIAQAQGVTDIILTPHYDAMGYYRLQKSELERRFAAFKEIIKTELPELNLYLGNELYINAKLPDLLAAGKICTLNGTAYVLVDFDFSDYPQSNDDILYDLKASGYKVIVAHPERYDYVKKDPNFCLRWLDAGYIIQINQDELLEKQQRSLSYGLIKHGFVSLMASDAHNERRSVHLKETYEILCQLFERQTADNFLVHNPAKLLKNEEIDHRGYTRLERKMFNHYI